MLVLEGVTQHFLTFCPLPSGSKTFNLGVLMQVSSYLRIGWVWYVHQHLISALQAGRPSGACMLMSA